MADAREILKGEYMPYAKGTIISRAIPYIDGLKPVQRRALYAMEELGCDKKFIKSNRIVGDTMGKYHPHGDSSIYDAICNMSTCYEGLNVPPILSKGNFGKHWSNSIKASHMRYTEAMLSPIAEEYFKGISHNAVDFKPNFDGTEKEPEFLPVTFPSIITNTLSGIAVGMSSRIPPYNLSSACEAAMAILSGRANKADDLVDILGAPDFKTGGNVHINDKDIKQLIETGCGSIVLSGNIEIKKNKLVITEIPNNTTIEEILDQIIELVKNKEIDGINDVTNTTDKDGMSGTISLKRGADANAVVNAIYRRTRLRCKMSFYSRVIVKGSNGKAECKLLGIYDILKYWCEWRESVVRRIVQFDLDKEKDKCHKLEVWEIINTDIRNVAQLISQNTEEDAIKLLKSKYGLDDMQIAYIMEQKIRALTINNMVKNVEKLKESRQLVSEYNDLLNNPVGIKKKIIIELGDIIKKYGKGRNTSVEEPIDEEANIREEEIVPDVTVSVVVTKKGYIKRYTNNMAALNAGTQLDDEDDIVETFICNNRARLLLFTMEGNCYQIPVHTIESNIRRGFNERIWDLVGKKDESELAYVIPSDDEKGYFNVVYGNGKGRKIWLDEIKDNRSMYKNVFKIPEGVDKIKITQADKIFMITHKRKAAYVDLTLLTRMHSSNTFKIASLRGDKLFGLQPLERVPDRDIIDLERYSKGYCVTIKDKLW